MVAAARLRQPTGVVARRAVVPRGLPARGRVASAAAAVGVVATMSAVAMSSDAVRVAGVRHVVHMVVGVPVTFPIMCVPVVSAVPAMGVPVVGGAAVVDVLVVGVPVVVRVSVGVVTVTPATAVVPESMHCAVRGPRSDGSLLNGSQLTCGEPTTNGGRLSRRPVSRWAAAGKAARQRHRRQRRWRPGEAAAIVIRRHGRRGASTPQPAADVAAGAATRVAFPTRPDSRRERPAVAGKPLGGRGRRRGGRPPGGRWFRCVGAAGRCRHWQGLRRHHHHLDHRR